jgi:hypothetical protein
MQYNCDECELHFATMEDLTMHYKQAHPKSAREFLKNVSC